MAENNPKNKIKALDIASLKKLLNDAAKSVKSGDLDKLKTTKDALVNIMTKVSRDSVASNRKQPPKPGQPKPPPPGLPLTRPKPSGGSGGGPGNKPGPDKGPGPGTNPGDGPGSGNKSGESKGPESTGNDNGKSPGNKQVPGQGDAPSDIEGKKEQTAKKASETPKIPEKVPAPTPEKKPETAPTPIKNPIVPPIPPPPIEVPITFPPEQPKLKFNFNPDAFDQKPILNKPHNVWRVSDRGSGPPYLANPNEPDYGNPELSDWKKYGLQNPEEFPLIPIDENGNRITPAKQRTIDGVPVDEYGHEAGSKDTYKASKRQKQEDAEAIEKMISSGLSRKEAERRRGVNYAESTPDFDKDKPTGDDDLATAAKNLENSRSIPEPPKPESVSPNNAEETKGGSSSEGGGGKGSGGSGGIDDGPKEGPMDGSNGRYVPGIIAPTISLWGLPGLLKLLGVYNDPSEKDHFEDAQGNVIPEFPINNTQDKIDAMLGIYGPGKDPAKREEYRAKIFKGMIDQHNEEEAAKTAASEKLRQDMSDRPWLYRKKGLTERLGEWWNKPKTTPYEPTVGPASPGYVEPKKTETKIKMPDGSTLGEDPKNTFKPEASNKSNSILNDGLGILSSDLFDSTKSQPLASNTGGSTIVNNYNNTMGGSTSTNTSNTMSPGLFMMSNPETTAQRVSYDMAKAAIL